MSRSRSFGFYCRTGYLFVDRSPWVRRVHPCYSFSCRSG
uniref:Uncharacterized protein n=1 Tax=Setaria italica TaxID=4555 RepID=K3ZPF1_SETIT